MALLQHNTATQYCSTLLQRITAAQYCNALLQHTTATHYCNTILQHTTATHYCNTLLQHTTATLYRLMVWLPLVGTFKLYVSFTEYRLFYRALLQKETYNSNESTNRSHPIPVPTLRACRQDLVLDVSFTEYRSFYRALLQKRPILLIGLLIEVTPYQSPHSEHADKI